MKDKLIDFVGVGAAKCGSTTLYRFLASHPDVFMSKIKETNFFSTDIDVGKFRSDFKLMERQKNLDIDEYVEGPQKREYYGGYVTSIEQYKKLFKNAKKNQLIGEISNSYLFSTTAAVNIAQMAPEAKIFMILRNPVSRMYSHYLANIRDGRVNKKFREEILDDLSYKNRKWGEAHCYVDFGLYYEQVKRYVDIFGIDNLKIYLNDDLDEKPASIAEDLYRFIGVSTDIEINANHRENIARTPKNQWLLYMLTRYGLKKKIYSWIPENNKKYMKGLFYKKGEAEPMREEDKVVAYEYFAEDIANLEKLIGRDLSRWKLK